MTSKKQFFKLSKLFKRRDCWVLKSQSFIFWKENPKFMQSDWLVYRLRMNNPFNNFCRLVKIFPIIAATDSQKWKKIYPQKTNSTKNSFDRFLGLFLIVFQTKVLSMTKKNFRKIIVLLQQHSMNLKILSSHLHDRLGRKKNTFIDRPLVFRSRGLVDSTRVVQLKSPMRDNQLDRLLKSNQLSSEIFRH